ncbi:MAG: NAD(P)-dependent oxidoreductase [Cyanobacteriota bacterium PSP.bin.10]|nr:NAD(P)-dependent oxidoreductase [Cyanobacteriota bacterium PSP.bin.10]
MRNLFLTGASGCLGHYVLERLAQQRDPEFPERPAYHLYVLIRETSRLRLPLERLPAPITWVPGDLLRIREHAALLHQMDGLIHMAAAWGDPALAWAVNVTHTLELFQLLDPERCQQVIYFSTASLLNQDLEPLAIAGRAGTDYIRSKYEMLLRRQESGFWPERLLTLYPTLLFGGSPHHPYSHITAGLKDVLRWLDLIRFLRVDASFHFIHAADVAEMVAHWVAHPPGAGDWVLGNSPLSLDECVEQVCAYFKKRIYFRVPLPLALVRGLAFLFRVRLSEWDEYCLRQRHFVYPALSPETLGLRCHFPTVASLLDTYL